MAKHYTFTWKTIRKVKEKTNGTCFYCGRQLPENTDEYDDVGRIVSSTRNWHVDHVIPLSRGGDHNIDNLVPSCMSCNMEKLTMTGDEYKRYRNENITSTNQ